MKIHAENGVYLGELISEHQHVIFRPVRDMTEYMLEQALKWIRKVNELP